MDFVIGLFRFNGYNTICIIINRLLKERYYIPCLTEDDQTNIEAITDILLNNVFRCYSLLNSIILDRGPQFVSALWQLFCKRLKIGFKLFIIYYPQING